MFDGTGRGSAAARARRVIGECGVIAVCGAALSLFALPQCAGAALITSADIFPTTGHEVGSGNGTLDFILMTESNGGAGNHAGSFNGDDANTALPTGAGRPTANATFITSMGELRSFYRLNFPDGSGGSTVHNMGMFIDINQVGPTSFLNLDDLRITVGYANFSPVNDTRNDPAGNDISSNVQNSTGTTWTGGTIASQLDASPKVLPLNNQGAGFADHLILTNIDPFANAYTDTTRVLFHWESSHHDDGGETIFLSGTFAPQDVASPEPGAIGVLAMSALLLARRRSV
jgi:hypothetical protein